MPRRSVILLVEDNVELRRMFRTALTIEGFDVREAGEGYEALRLLEQGVGISTRSATPEHRRDHHPARAARKTNNASVVVTASDEDVSRFDVAGVLRKPVTTDQLVAMVKKCLGAGV
jgi:CheY-like chemotaxis protein